jgi:Na+-driven multidrug efflux pump
MMGNNTMRAEGKPEYAMYAMMIPSITNLFLDYILIFYFDYGMYGAAWATTISYAVTAIYILYYFTSSKSEFKLKINDFYGDQTFFIKTFHISNKFIFLWIRLN